MLVCIALFLLVRYLVAFEFWVRVELLIGVGAVIVTWVLFSLMCLGVLCLTFSCCCIVALRWGWLGLWCFIWFCFVWFCWQVLFFLIFDYFDVSISFWVLRLTVGTCWVWVC